MFNFLKPKKSYKVTSETRWGCRYADIVQARNPAQAWKKVRKIHNYTIISYVGIEELK